MTHELMLEKKAQPVRVYLADGRVIPVTIFLVTEAEGPVSGRIVAETVEESVPVLPCRTEQGQFLCIGTQTIAAVSVSARDTWDEGFFLLRKCRVTLRGGHVFDGFVRHFLGTGDRLSDAFRRADDWIQLEVASEVVWFRVEKLLTAEELEPGPDTLAEEFEDDLPDGIRSLEGEAPQL